MTSEDKQRLLERERLEDVLREFDTEGPDRKNGKIKGQLLADKVAAKIAAQDRLAEMAKEDQV
ncbi:hypothetical protein [Arthrobacter sp. NPDC058192]|uniref:hypothetical protein n=1 Tax=Arthrobacter sp. NPDC058192 TaxID=3346372 RepID=UPI0036E830FA